jgi:hypothetical protein
MPIPRKEAEEWAVFLRTFFFLNLIFLGVFPD